MVYVSLRYYTRGHHSYRHYATPRVLLPGVKARSFRREAEQAGLSSSCTLNPPSPAPCEPPHPRRIGPAGLAHLPSWAAVWDGMGSRLSWIPQRIKPHKFHGVLRGIIGMRPYVRLSAAFYWRQTRTISTRLYAFYPPLSYYPLPPFPPIPMDIRSSVICMTARGWIRIVNGREDIRLTSLNIDFYDARKNAIFLAVKTRLNPVLLRWKIYRHFVINWVMRLNW